MKTHEPQLTEHPFLKGLEPRLLTLVTGCASHVRFNAGEYVAKEGDAANQFYLIREGKVAMEIYRPPEGVIIIQTLSDGDVLGWSWLVPPHNWRFNFRAVELTRAFAFDGTCLRNKLEQDHDLAYELFRRFIPIIVQRLEATRLQLLDLYGEQS